MEADGRLRLRSKSRSGEVLVMKKFGKMFWQQDLLSPGR